MLSNRHLPLLLSIIALFCLNIFMVLSQAPETLLKQLFAWIIGLCLFFLGRQINPRPTNAYKWWIFFACCLFLISPIILNNITRGSRRWINIGPLSLQPAELTKPWLLLFLVNSGQPLWLSIPIGIVLLQPDLGSAISIMSLSLPIILFNKKLLKISLLLALAAIALSPIIWTKGLKEYQRNRLVYFLDQTKDPLGQGYNLIQSKIAIGSGGLWGRGFRQGSQSQLSFLPEKHTDFAFAAIAEEIGLVGILIVLISYYFLISSLIKRAYQVTNRPTFLFTIGLATQIWVQLFINIGMNMGTLPVTGIPLPFLSVGGSSLMSLLFALGIVFSI